MNRHVKYPNKSEFENLKNNKNQQINHHISVKYHKRKFFWGENTSNERKKSELSKQTSILPKAKKYLTGRERN